MDKRIRIRLALACFFACLFVFRAAAIEYIFPAGANVVDITKSPYSADRTGQTDVSAILSKAANDIIANTSWAPGILYMPNGTYLVKNTFAWKVGSSGNGNGPRIIGQSRSGTIIKLAKGTWPLGTELKGVIQTGAGVEQNFSKGIVNLTVLVDSNNAGAIGIIYVSNNTGLISDVDVISADGKGAYGIQSAGNISGVGGNGPFIIRRTYIKGFAYGMRTGGTQGEMVSQIRLAGQSHTGIWASGNDLVIDSLTSNNTCPALEAQAPVMLTHALLTGGNPANCAIRNWVNTSYFSDIVSSGYRQAITSSGPNPVPTTASVAEYTPVVPVSLFSARKTSMHLPTKYPPEAAWETNFAKWAFIDDYKTGGRSDAQALQAAIDDPAKTTICLPRTKTYQLDQAVTVRGAINRIFGTGGVLQLSGSGQLVIGDGSAPQIALQNIFPTTGFIPLSKQTNRTLIIESGSFDMSILGGGETYVTDIVSQKNVIDNAQARVWLWQWEANYVNDGMVVRNGMVRSAGQYLEGDASNFVCEGGFTEILGSWYYSFCAGKSNLYMLIVRNNANVSAAGMFQQNFCNPSAGYTKLVQETRNGTTKILGADSASGNVKNPGGSNIALFTAYDSAQVQSALQTSIPDHHSPVASDREVGLFAKKTPDGIAVTFNATKSEPVTLLVCDLSGRMVGIVKENVSCSGTHRTLIPRSACPAGIACIEIRQSGESMRRLVVPANQ